MRILMLVALSLAACDTYDKETCVCFSGTNQSGSPS